MNKTEVKDYLKLLKEIMQENAGHVFVNNVPTSNELNYSYAESSFKHGRDWFAT